MLPLIYLCLIEQLLLKKCDFKKFNSEHLLMSHVSSSSSHDGQSMLLFFSVSFLYF